MLPSAVSTDYGRQALIVRGDGRVSGGVKMARYPSAGASFHIEDAHPRRGRERGAEPIEEFVRVLDLVVDVRKDGHVDRSRRQSGIPWLP